MQSGEDDPIAKMCQDEEQGSGDAKKEAKREEAKAPLAASSTPSSKQSKVRTLAAPHLGSKIRR